MSGPWVVIAAVVLVGMAYVVVPVALEAFRRHRRAQEICCPETGTGVRVHPDARWAALTGALRHPPQVRVRACTLWPARRDCGQRCVPLLGK